MTPRLIASGVRAAIAGAAMVVAVSSSPTFAFTLSSPSVADQVIKADVQQIYYYRRHYYYHHYYHRYYHPYYHRYYHPYYYHHYYYHPYYHRYYYHPIIIVIITISYISVTGAAARRLDHVLQDA